MRVSGLLKYFPVLALQIQPKRKWRGIVDVVITHIHTVSKDFCRVKTKRKQNKKKIKRESSVQSLVWEDPLKKGMATQSSIFAWKIPWTEGLVGYSPWGRKESDTTELLSLTHSEQNILIYLQYINFRFTGRNNFSFSAEKSLI